MGVFDITLGEFLRGLLLWFCLTAVFIMIVGALNKHSYQRAFGFVLGLLALGCIAALFQDTMRAGEATPLTYETRRWLVAQALVAAIGCALFEVANQLRRLVEASLADTREWRRQHAIDRGLHVVPRDDEATI